MKRVSVLTLLLAVSLIASAADLKYSAAVRNARLTQIEATVGPNPVLRLCGGSVPANVGQADGGPALATMTLPADWATSPVDGAVSKTGTWSDSAANANGTVTHFRLYASNGTTPHVQGNATVTGGGGIITLPSTTIKVGQPVTVNTFSITTGNP